MKRRFPSDFWARQSTSRGHAAHGASHVELRSIEHAVLEKLAADDSPLAVAAARVDRDGRPLCVYEPEHYEAKYPYPLVVWLHGGGGNERELLTAMPMISRRNYLGLSFRGTSSKTDAMAGGYHWSLAADDISRFESSLFEAVCGIRREYHVHSERVFLAGFDEGATVALDLLLRQPQRYGGAICLGGRYPETRHSLARYRDLRQTRVLISTGAGDKLSTPAEAVRVGRLLHAAGMSVSTRIVDAGHEVTRPMLRQIDHWIMDGICSSM